MTETWSPILFELLMVLAFAAGWMVLEWQGRRLDRQREERERGSDQNSHASDTTRD